MNTTEAIKSRVLKLLNLAECPEAVEGEIHNALAFARKLMDQHHLTEADLQDEEIREEKMGKTVATCGGSKMSSWESALGGALVALFGSIGWYVGGKTKSRDEFGFLQRGETDRQTAIFYGPVEDAELAKDMFEEIGKTIATMARLKWGGVYRGEGRSYCEGFAYELLNRVRKDVRENRTEQCKALVLVKADDAKKWLKNVEGVRLRSRGGGSGGGLHHHDSYGDGRSDGQKSDFQPRRRPKLNGGKMLPA